MKQKQQNLTTTMNEKVTCIKFVTFNIIQLFLLMKDRFGLQPILDTYKAFTIDGANELRYESSTRPPVLNADSDATVVMGMANMSRITRAKIGYLVELTFH